MNHLTGTWESRMLHFTQKQMMDKEGDNYSTKNRYWKVGVETKTIDWNKLEQLNIGTTNFATSHLQI